MSLPEITLESVLGTHQLRGPQEFTIGELLAANRLPETLFQPYAVDGDDASPVPLSTRIADLDGVDRLLIRAIRNTLLPTVTPEHHQTVNAERGVGFRSIRATDGDLAEELHAVIGYEQARELVTKEVLAFEQQHHLTAGGCIFGVSGGGDSNALAYGLRRAMPTDRLTAFTLVFGPVFSEDAAVRATVLCQDLGISHRVLYPDDIAAFLKMSSTVDELYADFSDMFSDNALHFFGTFLILRTARRLAAEGGFANLAFGYNREDLLAEVLFMLMNGHRPLAFPVRPMGDQRVVMPVWQVPKLLLDACHPQFSLENYRERDPYTTRQRSLGFFLAHALDSAYPSFGLSLLVGLSKVLEEIWGGLHYDEESDLFVTAQAESASIESVRALLARHFD
jgi:hypothetical protein